MNIGNPLQLGFPVSKFLMDYDREKKKKRILMKLGINNTVESYI